ncbi:type I-E CRISPR-associated protein Cse2/CasB [Streptomyces sp. NPDC087420]|uniref:type I-E CRISPR-associated protein Cse2/CasB n=1 Tax=unclassified Streptomyces TaxID=2593676 RepID=UPI002E154A7A|nr:type I-E CRISPR-associated protein Cse2/CasB [Streptomyces sp. NBC_01317]
MSTLPLPAPAPTRPRYWNRHVDSHGNWRIDHASGAKMHTPGEELSDLRAGLGQTAFTVSQLWPYYTTPTDGRVTPELEAEHAALALYGLHQQSQNRPMHRRGVSAGAALRALRRSGRYSEAALDGHVAATVQTTTVAALVYRLRGLITQLRSVEQPLDYDQLLTDIQRWDSPVVRNRVRREWGLAYQVVERGNR